MHSRMAKKTEAFKVDARAIVDYKSEEIDLAVVEAAETVSLGWPIT